MPLKKAKAKVSKPKAKKVKVVEVPVEDLEVVEPVAYSKPLPKTVGPITKPVVKDYKEKDWNKAEPVVFEGNTVLQVLGDGHTDTHLHCRMSNGTTQHVPKARFN